MKTTDRFDYSNDFGSWRNCRFVAKRRSTFSNRSLAIVSGKRVLCVCTADVGVFLRENEICVNPNCDDENVAKFLAKLGVVGRRPSWYVSVGYGKYPIYKLTKSGQELFAKPAKKTANGGKTR